MQKRKFDELISHFNRKVSDMSIDQKYKMELLGMISAIGFAHEKELGTNLAEVGTDLISRQQAIDDIWTVSPLARLDRKWVDRWLRQLPPAQPIIRCKDCAWWTKQEDSLQGRCALLQIYPTGEWFCGNAGRREETA